VVIQLHLLLLHLQSPVPLSLLTGTGKPSVTHELEELLPPLSPGLAPTELEGDHLHIGSSFGPF
jgi:hypothetical protein